MKAGFLLAGMAIVLVGCAAKQTVLCSRFYFEERERIDLSEVEKNLVCGNPDLPAWQSIPDNQAIFNLSNFLQARGYFQPKFDRVAGERGKLKVTLGPRARANELRDEGAPRDLGMKRLRGHHGEVLTPGLLDTVKARVTRLLESEGYPCSSVEMRGDYTSGDLLAVIKPGARLNIERIEEEPVEDLAPGTLRRFDAFHPGDRFDAELLALTVQRTLDDGIVQSTFFTVSCTPTGAVLRQAIVPGPSRQVAIAFGANTERGPIGRASWKSSRLGSFGSSLEALLTASLAEQDLSVTLNWYYLGHPSRHYLKPTIGIRHENILPRENLTSRFQILPAWRWDDQHVKLELSFGPTLNVEHTLRGLGPTSSAFLTLGLQSKLVSHYFELYRTDPHEGFEMALEAQFAQRELAASFTAQTFKITAQKLWNLGRYTPSSVVIGLRGGVAATFTSENVTGRVLPSSFRYFLGGSRDLRGFSYQELPGTEDGALTSLFLGMEVRLCDMLPLNIQPLLLLDAGVLGRPSVVLEPPLFWSPGAGLRLPTPIGVFRSTLARGFLIGDKAGTKPTHWQFLLSYGEEF